MKDIGVVGYGSWATAIVKMFQENGRALHWWVKHNESVEYILKCKTPPKYLKSVELKTNILTLHTNIESVFSECDTILLAIPAFYCEKILENLKMPQEKRKNKHFIISLKGVFPVSGKSCYHYLLERWGIPKRNLSILTGPCHAEEVAKEKRAYLTLGSENKDTKVEIITRLSSEKIKITPTSATESLEYSAILKNIYSILSGIFQSKNYGDNFKSVLACNAAKEIREFIEYEGLSDVSILDSALLGDLLVTMYSPYSRNNTFGKYIGEGLSSEKAIQKLSMIPEGYYSLLAQEKHTIFPTHKMPLLLETVDMVFGKKSIQEGLSQIEKKLV